MKRLLYILPCLAIWLGCRKELKMPGWDTQLLAPVVYSDMGLGNIIPDSLLQSESDSSLTLILDKVIYSLGVDSVLPIPDSVFRDTFYLPFSLAVPAGSNFINQTNEKKMDLNGPELTQLILKKGTLDYTVTSRVADTTIVTYTITSATRYAQPVVLVITVPPGSVPSPVSVSGSFDLSAVDFDLRGSAFNDYNTIITDLQVSLAPGVTGTTVGPLNQVYLDTRFHDLVADYAIGYFGQQSIDIPYETQNFSDLANINQAVLDINSANARLTITNGVGADARVKIDSLSGKNSFYGSTLLLNHSQLGVPVNINRATDLGYAAQPYVYTLNMNQSNSNIEPFIENLPDKVGYSGHIDINPLGNVSNHTDFLRSNSKVEVGLHLEVPLNLSASNVVLEDTVSFNMDDLDGNGHFNDILFRFLLENGFPMQAVVDVYMLDQNKMSIGTLASGLQISSGTLNASNVVVQPSKETKEIFANADKMEKLYRSKYLRIHVSFQTSGTGKVIFYDWYRFKSKLIIDASYLTRE